MNELKLIPLDHALAGSPDPVEVSPPGEPMPNARQFLKANFDNADRSLLIHQGGQFYHWDGACWPDIEDRMIRSELYKWFERNWYLDKSKKEPEQKPFAPTMRKTADLLDALRAVTFISTATSVPSWLTSSPLPANEIIPCGNGLVHWPTRKIYPHTPNFYVHHSVPFDFDPNAPRPDRWLSFLRELWGDDDGSIAALQELFGYMVSGDTRQQKMFLLVGPKRGGKGTIARLLTAMLGQHNVANPTLASLGTNFGLQPLVGKPIAIISDARLGGKTDGSIVTERLLSISGEDSLTIDRKYLDAWTGQLPTRIIMLTNELPNFRDSSGALSSRFIVFAMTKSFYGKEDPNLTAQLIAELPGIFCWALDGLARLRERGYFVQPEASEGAIQQLEDLGSPIGAFIRDCCIIQPGAEVPVDDMFIAWKLWCEHQGRSNHGNRQTFGRDLRAALPGLRITNRRTDGDKRRRYYEGVAVSAP